MFSYFAGSGVGCTTVVGRTSADWTWASHVTILMSARCRRGFSLEAGAHHVTSSEGHRDGARGCHAKSKQSPTAHSLVVHWMPSLEERFDPAHRGGIWVTSVQPNSLRCPRFGPGPIRFLAASNALSDLGQREREYGAAAAARACPYTAGLRLDEKLADSEADACAANLRRRFV